MSQSNRWDDYFMDLAVRSARMSYCERLKVGAVAVRNRRPILSGWNGTAPGEDNCCEEEVQDVEAKTMEFETAGAMLKAFKLAQTQLDTYKQFSKSRNATLRTKLSVNHAERNLIEHAAAEGISLRGCDLYITHAPCVECAKSIANAGFVSIIWKDIYRCDAGLRYLSDKLTVRRYE